MDKKKFQTGIRLTPNQKHAITEISQKTKIHSSVIIRFAIDHFLKEFQPTLDNLPPRMARQLEIFKDNDKE